MLANGDAETDACEMDRNVTSPTGWNYNGSITQTSYSNTFYNFQRYTTPGPRLAIRLDTSIVSLLRVILVIEETVIFQAMYQRKQQCGKLLT